LREHKEPSLEALQSELLKLKNTRIFMCGAEPTCRGDLPEVIKASARYNTTFLMARGIRLADMDYTHSLKEAGLHAAILAFNGLNDEIYR